MILAGNVALIAGPMCEKQFRIKRFSNGLRSSSSTRPAMDFRPATERPHSPLAVEISNRAIEAHLLAGMLFEHLVEPQRNRWRDDQSLFGDDTRSIVLRSRA
jgi:hypothetical protein